MSRTRRGVSCSGRWDANDKALGPPRGRQFCSRFPRDVGPPSAVPWGRGPGRTASPPVCECGPASLSLGGGCALRLDASGVARALGLVSSLTPLSLGPAGGTVYFILRFFPRRARRLPPAQGPEIDDFDSSRFLGGLSRGNILGLVVLLVFCLFVCLFELILKIRLRLQ